jgi:hypothetical protein
MTKDADMMRLLTWVNILLLAANVFGLGYETGQHRFMMPVPVAGILLPAGTLLATIYAIYIIITLVALAQLMSHQENHKSDEILLALILEMQGRVASLTQQSVKMQEQWPIMAADPMVPIEQVIQLDTDIQSILARRAEAEEAVSVITHTLDQATKPRR